MSNTSATPASGYPALSDVPAPAVSPEGRAFNLAVSTAVRQLNNAGYAGAGREVTFSIDRATHQPVIKVIDSQTKEVITQFPPKYVLALADDSNQIT